MTPNFENIIESIQQLPAIEQEKIWYWLEEKRKPRPTEENWSERSEKFQLAMRWVEEHRGEFLGKWICLDGENSLATVKMLRKSIRRQNQKASKFLLLSRLAKIKLRRIGMVGNRC